MVLNTEQLLADLVAGVFIWSGAAKLWKPLPAAMAAVDFGILTRVSPAVGLSLGTLELCLGGWILSEIWIVPAMTVVSGLLLIFGALIATALIRGKSFSCACFRRRRRRDIEVDFGARRRAARDRRGGDVGRRGRARSW